MSSSGIDKLRAGSGQALYRHAKSIIPGGTQLLSKRPEMFAPEVWPAYYQRAKGCRVWDLDENEYIDMSIMGLGANILGYADDEVDAAVTEAIAKGASSSLNCPEDVELADLLLELHPWAQMVRYARSGGEAMAIAARIARAATGRDIILFSGYHGWTDWYLAANLAEGDGLDGQLLPGLEPKGVPRGLTGTAIPFHLGTPGSMQDALRGREKDVAAIVVEPARGAELDAEILAELRSSASNVGAVLVFDEITSGFRMCAGGIHLRYNVHPDMAVFAKSMANGYAMAAVIGIEKVMEAAQSTFISSTSWTDRIGPTAALATIRKYIREKADEHIIRIGSAVQDIWTSRGKAHGLDIKVSGLPTLGNLAFQGKHSATISTYFTIELLTAGFLGFRQFKPSLAHGDEEVASYTTAVDAVFEKIAHTTPDRLLTTPPAHTGFFRLTRE